MLDRLALVLLMRMQVCCVEGIKQALLDACDLYKTSRRSAGSSGGSGVWYSAFVNDLLCILQDLIVQHKQVTAIARLI
jgi:hypothetical protein